MTDHDEEMSTGLFIFYALVVLAMIGLFVGLSWEAMTDCDDGTIVRGAFNLECVDKEPQP